MNDSGWEQGNTLFIICYFINDFHDVYLRLCFIISDFVIY